MNHGRQLRAALAVLGAILLIVAFVLDIEGTWETLLSVCAEFLILVGTLMAWSTARQEVSAAVRTMRRRQWTR